MCTIITYIKAGKIPTTRFYRNVFTSDISIFLLLTGNIKHWKFPCLCRKMRSGLPSSKWCAPEKLLCGAAYRNIMLWVDCSIAAVLCHHNFSFFILIFSFCHSARGFITWDRLGHALSRERITELPRYCWIMHTIHRNELQPGCNKSVKIWSKLLKKAKKIIQQWYYCTRKQLALCFDLWYNERIQTKEMLIGHSSLHKNHVIMKRRKELW